MSPQNFFKKRVQCLASKKPSSKVPTTKKKKKKYRGVNGLEIEDEMLTNAQEDGLER